MVDTVGTVVCCTVEEIVGVVVELDVVVGVDIGVVIGEVGASVKNPANHWPISIS